MRPPWPRVKLGEVCEVKAGDSAPQDKALFIDGVYPFVRTSDVGAIHFGALNESRDKLNEAGTQKLHLFKAGSILFPKSGASTFLNHRVLLDVDAYVASHLAVITPGGKVNSKYLLNLLAQVDAKDLMQDTSYPALRTSEIEDVEIDLPPLPVQHSIVERLERELGAVDKLAKKLEELETAAEAEFKAELKETFERFEKFEGFAKFERLGEDEMVGRSVPDRRNRMTTKNALRDGCGGEGTRRPTAVRWVKLGDVCSKIGSGATPLGGKKTYCDDGVGLIRSQNVLDLSFSFKGLAHINDEQADRLKSVTVLAQDVLLNITGDSVARACVVDDNALPARVNQHVAIIRVENSKILLPRFLELWLISYKPKLLEESQKGSTRKALTKDYLFDLAIPLPPLDAQRSIVSQLDAAKAKKEAMVAAAKRGREAVALWRKAILKETFE